MKKSHLLAATMCSAILIAGGAYADPPDQPGHVSPAPGTNNDTVSAVKDTTAKAVGVVGAEVTTTAQSFIASAATSDLYEVEAAKIAIQRSKNPQIVDFAKTMIHDHTASTEKLKATLASVKGFNIPTTLDDRRQGMIDDLRGAKSADFDGRYVSQQVGAHQEAAILMRGYAKDGDNADLKQFAADLAPKVQMHLDMAQSLAKATGQS